jgi:Dockerin type I domain
MSVTRGTGDIAFAIATGHAIGEVRLDNLRVGPETAVTTTAQGVYAFPSLPAGSYRVQVSRPDVSPLSPSNGQQNAKVFANTPTADVDFGFVASSHLWQNPRNRFNVNDDEEITPLDALIVIDDLSRRGSRDLVGTSPVAPPYIDVSGDNQVSPLDVLLIVDVLVKRSSGGVSEAESMNEYTVLSVVPSSNELLTPCIPMFGPELSTINWDEKHRKDRYYHSAVTDQSIVEIQDGIDAESGSL